MFNYARATIFLILLLIFIIGVFSASFLKPNIIDHALWWFGGLVAALAAAILFWQNKIVRLFSLAAVFLFLGFWRYSLALPANTPDKIWHYNGQEVILRGVVAAEPDQREKNVRYTVETLRLKVGASLREKKITGQVLVITSLYPAYNYGDKLEINCRLEAPQPFDDFAYDRYLARYNIYSACFYPEIKFSGSNLSYRQPLNWFYSKIFQLKDKLRQSINLGLAEPEAALAAGIILGDQRQMSDDLREDFSRTGLSHIVAISGMNITILAVFVLNFFLALGCWRKHTFYLANLLIFTYLILIGLPVSALRAGLMAFLVLWALQLGRLNKLTNSLVLAGAILLLFNPRLLRDDVGFQLSFLALLGLIYFYPLLAERFNHWRLPGLWGAREVFGLTLSAQAFTLPLLAYNFSRISLIAPLANLLVLWTLPVLMVALFLALALGLLLPGLAIWFFLPAGFFLKYMIMVAQESAKLPGAYLETFYPWLGWAVIYYLIIIYLILRNKSPRAQL